MNISMFWNNLNKLNEQQLKESGFDNFKRTINNNYFNWNQVGFRHPLFLSMFTEFLFHPTPDILRVRFHEDNLNLSYKLYLAMLYMYMRRTDTAKLIDRLEEPQTGSPLKIRYLNKWISQDLCHSIDEFNRIASVGLPYPPHILEIGAGYGRTAYVFLKAIKNCRYTIVDIEPALSVSRTYLNELFPDRDIKFLSPEEFRDSNDKYDLAINISSFHEMTPETIKEYFDLIDKKVKGYLYFKEWIRFNNPDDKVSVGIKDYPVKDSWKGVYLDRCKIQTRFFEAMYKV